MGAYAFGDTSVAAQRLTKVHEVFAPTSTNFIERSAPDERRLALDLGCGPGHTTHLLSQTLGAAYTIGLDCSKRFLDLANSTATDAVAFAFHDVTTVPLPRSRANVIYCRFLLSHLTDVSGLIDAWGVHLAPGGRLALDEVKSIETEDSVFGTYLKIVQGMLAARGSSLFVGRDIVDTEHLKRLRLVEDTTVSFEPQSVDVAAMFLPNLLVWRSDPYVKSNYPDSTIYALQHSLAEIAEGRSAEPIRWHLRQVAVERSA